MIARSRAEIGKGSGADYLYTYLRTFYRDDTRPTGWNNLAFPDVAMPHVLWELQGQQRAKFVEAKDPHDDGKTIRRFAGFEQITPGHAERTPIRRSGGPTSWPTFSGWANPPRASASASASAC